jgi:hypothetical protein
MYRNFQVALYIRLESAKIILQSGGVNPLLPVDKSVNSILPMGVELSVRLF